MEPCVSILVTLSTGREFDLHIYGGVNFSLSQPWADWNRRFPETRGRHTPLLPRLTFGHALAVCPRTSATSCRRWKLAAFHHGFCRTTTSDATLLVRWSRRSEGRCGIGQAESCSFSLIDSAWLYRVRCWEDMEDVSNKSNIFFKSSKSWSSWWFSKSRWWRKIITFWRKRLKFSTLLRPLQQISLVGCVFFGTQSRSFLLPFSPLLPPNIGYCSPPFFGFGPAWTSESGPQNTRTDEACDGSQHLPPLNPSCFDCVPCLPSFCLFFVFHLFLCLPMLSLSDSLPKWH